MAVHELRCDPENKPGALSVLGQGREDEMDPVGHLFRVERVEVGPLKLFSRFRMLLSPRLPVRPSISSAGPLAMCSCTNAVCGEKEQGTLRLALTYPLPRLGVAAKWVGGVLSLCVPCAGTLGAWIYLSFTPTFEITIDHAMRFLLIFVVSVIYLSTSFTLGLLVSCLTPGPQPR